MYDAFIITVAVVQAVSIALIRSYYKFKYSGGWAMYKYIDQSHRIGAKVADKEKVQRILNTGPVNGGTEADKFSELVVTNMMSVHIMVRYLAQSTGVSEDKAVPQLAKMLFEAMDRDA